MNLQTLSDKHWRLANQVAPTTATVRGIHDFDDRLPRWDDGWLAEMADGFQEIEDGAESMDPKTLSIKDQITRSLLTHQARTARTQLEKPFLRAPIDPYLGPHTRLLSDTRQNTVANVEQAEMLLARYRGVPEFLSGAMDTHRGNSANGQTPAEASVDRVVEQLNRYLDSGLEDDPFLLLDVPGGNSSWLEQAEALVTGTIRPALAEYRDNLINDIAPTARPDDKPGLAWIPEGEEIYAGLIARYTQLETSAQAIHDIGQTWATEINAAEWVEIGQSAFGLDNLEEVFERLHTDPSLRFSSEEQMLEHARGALERAWSAVDDWFAHRPETACTVVPVPSAVAPAMPPAYYSMPPVDGSRPGTYFLNTYKPEERDLFEYESIHFHEGIPGHHFDRSLAAELEGIPTFRRYAMVYAHTEGWGLYAERLADEMGLYSSDVDRLGMISADAWRAGRLVTDTGMHALGWSRQQAIEFLRAWTPIGLLTVEQEVDRYIGMAGQALSYKMGQLEIMRLRELAENELGADFDIKGFHDTMLVDGAMPLPMLEVAVEEWIGSTR